MIDDNGDVWVTPSAEDKGSLKLSEIMSVKSDGTIIGPHKLSSEYPFYIAIYKSRPDKKSSCKLSTGWK
jgi:L-fuculose-phosphate aldolase